jgi:hypothetical protein
MKFVQVPKGTFWMGWDSVKKQSKQVESVSSSRRAGNY